MLVLIGDTISVARQDDQVAFRFTEKESVLVNTSNCRTPDCLIVAANLLQLVLDPILAGDVLHDTDTLHEIGNHDHVVDYGNIDGRSRCPISCKLLQLECSRVIINRLVDNDLEIVSN